MTDLMAGHVPVGFVDFGTARANKDLSHLKPLAVTSRERSPYFPLTPTFGELGIQGLDLEGWFVVLAPAKTDPAIVKKLAQEFAKAVRSPKIKQRLEDLGVTVVANPPDVFAANLRRDEAKWKRPSPMPPSTWIDSSQLIKASCTRTSHLPLSAT